MKLSFLNKRDPEEFLDFVFKETENFNFDYKSSENCAIVGNSGKILGTSSGKEIDNHDCVIRFNAAPTEGYEEDVGGKTNFRILNGPIMVGGSVDYVNTPLNWVEGLRNQNLILLPHERKRRPRKYNTAYDLIHESNNIFKTTDNFEKGVKEVSSSQGIRKPSTGLKTIFIFLGLIGKVDLYGFGFHLENDLTKRHYWEEFKFNAPGGHNWSREKNFVKKLVSYYNLNLKGSYE